jgi:hypothetical protein
MRTLPKRYRVGAGFLVCVFLVACQPAGCQNSPSQSSLKVALVKGSAPPSANGQMMIRGQVTVRDKNLVGATVTAYDALSDQPLAVAGSPESVTDSQGRFSVPVRTLAPDTVVKVVARHRSGNLSALVLGNGLGLSETAGYRLQQTPAVSVSVTAGTTLLARVVVPTLRFASQIESRLQLSAFETIMREATAVLTQLNQELSKKPELVDTVIAKTTTAGDLEEASLTQLVETAGIRSGLQAIVNNAAEVLKQQLAAGGTIDAPITVVLAVPGIDRTIEATATGIVIKSADGNVVFSTGFNQGSPSPSEAPSPSASGAAGGGGGGGGGSATAPGGLPTPSNATKFLPVVDSLTLSSDRLRFTVIQPAGQEDIKHVVIRLKRVDAGNQATADFNDSFSGILNAPGELSVRIPAGDPAFDCTIAPVNKLPNTFSLPAQFGAGQLTGTSAIYTGMLKRTSDGFAIANVQVFENVNFVYVVMAYAANGFELNRGHSTTMSIPRDRWTTLTAESKPEIYVESRLGNTAHLEKGIQAL